MLKPAYGKRKNKIAILFLEIIISSLFCPGKENNKGQHAVTIHLYKVLKPSNPPALQNSFVGFEFKKKEERVEKAVESVLALSLSCCFFFFFFSFLWKFESEFSTVKQSPNQTGTKLELCMHIKHKVALKKSQVFIKIQFELQMTVQK